MPRIVQIEKARGSRFEKCSWDGDLGKELANWKTNYSWIGRYL